MIRFPARCGLVCAVIFVLSLSACSINQMAMRAAADALSGAGSGTVFTGDDDPELVAEAIPFAIKVYEALLDQMPDHDGLSATTGSLFVMYANAFVQTPAELTGDDDYAKKKAALARAKKLYLRGFRILSARLEVKYPGASEKIDSTIRAKALARCGKADLPFLYWGGAAAMAAFSLDPLDIEAGRNVALVSDFMARAYALDPDFNRGAIDDFYVSYYAGLPSGMGGSKEKAREHFVLAEKKAAGKNASPYVSAATALAIPEQNYPLFKEMIEKALAVDPDADPSLKLANIITQRKARFLEASAEYLFVSLGDTPEGDME